eukprot:scaffold6120_cov162-Amphora_coffeaeformis.AAC.3
MGNPDLLGSDDDDGLGQEDAKISINKRFAKDFQLRKQREDLRNNPIALSDEDDDASTSSEEDEDGELLTTKLDTDIFKTINALRSKDSKIYDPNVKFFPSDNEEEGEDDSEDDDNKKDKKKQKPKRYKDVVREQALEQIEKEEEGVDDEDGDDEGPAELGKLRRLAYDKEQENIRKSFLQSTRGFENNDNNDVEEEEEDDLLVVKKKDPKELEREEQELAKEIQRIESTFAKGKEKDYVDPKGEVDDGSKFLLQYFKNRAWIDKDHMDGQSSDEDDAPTFQAKRTNPSGDEVMPMKSGAEEKDGNESDASLDQLEKSDDFEAQYNFRFEEAVGGTQSGADFSLVTYARGQTVNTLRRKDETRREKRLARKERKAAERKAKEEELKRLKNLKRKEMERKLKEVKKVVGLADQDAEMDEAAILKLIEGDYDPEEFEKKMQETFGDDFYSKEDKEWKSDKDVRETLMKDEDGNLIVGHDKEGDMYDDTVGDDAEEEENGGDDNEDDDDEWNDEGNYEGEEGGAYEEEEETELEKKIKSKMEDDLYKLDYEDIVAGMPTRFKYRQVEPNDYGLTTEEILFARDTTLKQFVSLKKMAPYRDDGEYNAGGRRRRRFREILKHEIEEEIGQTEKETKDESNEAPEPETGGSKKRKRRRSKKTNGDDEGGDKMAEQGTAGDGKKRSASMEATGKEIAADGENTSSDPKHKRRRRQKKKKSTSNTDENVPNLHTESGASVTDRAVKASADGETKNKANNSPSDSISTKVAVAKDTQEEATQTIKKKEKKHKKEKRDDGKRDKKKKKKSHIEGISKSRLSSYGM